MVGESPDELESRSNALLPSTEPDEAWLETSSSGKILTVLSLCNVHFFFSFRLSSAILVMII